MSPLANGGRPKKRERRKALMGKGVECRIFWKKIDILGIWWKERRKEKGKRKRKRICKRKEF